MNKQVKTIVTERTKVRRLAKRGAYDFRTIANILDASFICHVGFIVNKQPFVIPTCYGRHENEIFFHGAKGSRMLKHLKTGSEICITVTKVDGIVLARSAFHHSINYRSVVMFGIADEISEPVTKLNALKIITEHIVPGRWEDVRKPREKELNVTSVFSLKISEASAKIREGGPIDEEGDKDLNIWAGILPLNIISGIPVKASDLKDDISLPDYLLNYDNV